MLLVAVVVLQWSNTKYTASDLLLCLSEQEKDRQSHLEQEEEKLSLELQQKEMELQKLKDEGKLTEEQRSRSVLAKLEDLERKRARVYEVGPIHPQDDHDDTHRRCCTLLGCSWLAG